MELDTERLILGKWHERYFPKYAEIFGDPLTARFIGGVMDRPRAWRHMAALAGHWSLRGFGTWAVLAKDIGEFVGSIGLWRPEGWPELEMGYWLVPEAYGRGYATEAGAASLKFAFEKLSADSVVSYIDPDNEPSKRVAERLGGQLSETIELLDLGTHCVYRYFAKDND